MVRTALKTIEWQTDRDFECWVVDDGSSDKTAEALKPYEGRPAFHVLASPLNQGMNASRNLAIQRATGSFITFLDSDDLWLPERLEAFRRRIQEAPRAEFLFSNSYLLRYGRIVGTLFDPCRAIPEGRVPGYYAIGGQRLPYVTTNVAIARSAFERHGLFRTEMKTLDTELFVRFLGHGLPVAVLRQPLSVRRLHEDQLTDRYEENFRESLQALEASDAPGELRPGIREAVAREVGLYLVKAGSPGKARTFLRTHLGPSAPRGWDWWLSLLPGWLLLALKRLRKGALRLRYHPLWTPSSFRRTLETIKPLLEAGSTPGQG